MNRVRISFFGLLALFFLFPTKFSYSSVPKSGDCFSYMGQNWCFSRYEGSFVYKYPDCTPSGEIVIQDYRRQAYSPSNITICKWVKNSECNHTLSCYIFYANPNGTPNWPDVCDSSDDDSDGVCNSCDKSPGVADKKHCVWSQSYTADGRIGFMEIDQSGNCDGSNTVSRKNSQLDSETQYFDISHNHEEISAPTCAGDDGSGSCKCDYNSSVPSTLSPTSDTVDPKTKEELEKLPDDSNCAEIKAACESACLKYGGTKTNTCTSSNRKTISSCACLDSTTINTITKDNSTTTNTTEGNVSSTGGQDSNSDGKDDTYAAVKDAINDSGIGSKINSTNSLLNGIGNDINGIGNGINGILDSLKNGNTSGSADVPDHNNYDPSVDELQEESFGEAIINFMSSGLPLIDFIRGTGINNGSGESSLTFNVFGSDLELDFAPYSDLLEWVGLVLVFIASIIAFRIITNS